jgi:hypothetical protein
MVVITYVVTCISDYRWEIIRRWIPSGTLVRRSSQGWTSTVPGLRSAMSFHFGCCPSRIGPMFRTFSYSVVRATGYQLAATAAIIYTCL